MSQFDLYVNTDKDTKKTYPYFIDVQNDLLDTLNSRLAIPLTPRARGDKPYPANLCPLIKIRGKEFALLTHQMTSIPVSFLQKKEGTLSRFRKEIVSAIDFLITGI
ncbi:MAG: plasmid maintenance protein CcdB [Gammaproteobacteria bacterium]|jgi:toxin CcdB|nr:MAG: plasmid maintenance protein CcdB [Gammaproteobacteria bacterium]